MMKHVFGSLWDVAHVYAHPRCDNDHGRNGSDSMSFHGNIGYSYAAGVINRQRTPDGSHVYLISSEYRGYSMSTSRHIRLFEQAINGCTFDVPDIDPRTVADHVENWKYLRAECNNAINAFTRHPAPRDYMLNTIATHAGTANSYAKTFALDGHPDVCHVGLTAAQYSEMGDRIRQADIIRDARALRIQAQAEVDAERLAGERERERISQARRTFYHKLMPWLIGEPRTAYGRTTMTARATRRGIAEWLNGASVPAYNLGIDSRKDARLRLIERDGTRYVETSGGIRITVNDASLRAFSVLVGLCESIRKGERKFDSRRSRLEFKGQYTSHPIQRIDSTGHVTSGCHGFSYATLREMAIQLGCVKPTLAERAKSMLS